MSLTLEQSAALVGSHCWAERRLFELLGHWSAQATLPAVALALDRHSQHAAWRGGQWWDRLPVLAGVDRDDLVAPGPAWWALSGAAADVGATVAGPGDGGPSAEGPGPAVEGSGGPPGDVALLARAYRVALPRLAVAYAHHDAVTVAVCDGPVRRTLGHVRPDIASDWAEGEAVLQGLLVDSGSVDAAAMAVAASEHRFVT